MEDDGAGDDESGFNRRIVEVLSSIAGVSRDYLGQDY